MMDMHTFEKATDLLAKRKHHLDRLAKACDHGPQGSKLGITLQGHYQDESFVMAIRPHVVVLILNQISHVDYDLRRIGVEPDPIPEHLAPDWTYALVKREGA